MKKLIVLLFCILMLNPLVGADEIISRNRTTTSTTTQSQPQENPNPKSIDTSVSERKMSQEDDGWDIDLGNSLTYILVYVLGVLTGVGLIVAIIRLSGVSTSSDEIKL